MPGSDPLTVVLALAGVAGAWLIGSVAHPLIGQLNGPMCAGVAYGVGLVWISLAIPVAAFLGWPLTDRAGLGLVIGCPLAWWLGRRVVDVRRRADRTSDGPVVRRETLLARDPVWGGFVAALVVLAVIVAVRALVKPLVGWDAWAVHSFKAKVIVLAQAIPPSLFGWIGAPNYPLGIPLQEVWMAWVVGAWNEVAVKLLFPGYLVAIWLIVYGTLRERWSPRGAIAGTLFVAGMPLALQHGQDAYLDLPTAYFLLGSGVALMRYAVGADRRDLALASVFAAGAVWTREDALVVIAVNVVLLGVVLARPSRRAVMSRVADLLLYGALPVAVWGAWSIAKLQMGIVSNLDVGPAAWVWQFDRFRVVVVVFIRSLFLEGNWLLLWGLFVVALVFARDAAREPWSLFLVWPVVVYLLSMGLLMEATELFDYVSVSTVVNRLILHVAPLAALWVAMTYGRWWGLAESPRGDRVEG